MVTVFFNSMSQTILYKKNNGKRFASVSCGLDAQQKSSSINQHMHSIVSGEIPVCVLPRCRENWGKKKVKVKKKK